MFLRSQTRTSPGPVAAGHVILRRKCACEGSSAGGCQECLRKSSTAAPKKSVVPPIVHEVLRSSGQPLDAGTRSFMASRFHNVLGAPAENPQRVAPERNLQTNHPGDTHEREADDLAGQVMNAGEKHASHAGHSFQNIRVHTGERAAESARAIGAHAYAVGQDVVFGSGQYAPHTTAGQRLLAHELAHTVQQGAGAGRTIMGAWDKAESECAANAEKDKWIEKVVVNQEDPQNVTLHWSDGTEESGICSSGKGHCCVDDANPSGVACTIAGSHVDGSNCTPITQHMGFPVKNRVLDHKGVLWWTEFEPARAIALHQYSPVNGHPLSHGCVRLQEATAKKIFCNVRQNKTWVQVHGFARPKCSEKSVQDEWMGDFAMGGLDISKADGDLKASVLETRKELNAAFGRTLSVAEIQKFTEKDIPRCTSTAPLPKPATTTP